ncbi:iron chelate uptake ABC transporter family permease subunit [Streptosporangium canum]|uniref:iron chelate uptake ABC transporter family permease subunit n=1 Tax=Streptosporangium canum TaxID=324952 RepID=UPI0033BBC3FB
MRWTGLAVSCAVLAVAAVLSIAIGAQTIPLGELWRELWHPAGGETAAIIHDLRIPRTLLAVYALGATGRGAANPARLVLAGTAVSAALTARCP